MSNFWINFGRFVFYLWLFLLPWQTRYFWPGVLNGGFWEYGTYSLFATDILFLIWAGLTIASAIGQRRSDWRTPGSLPQPLKVALVALILGATVSLPFSFDPYLSLYYFVRVLAAISLIWLIPMVGSSIKKVAAVLVSSALLQALIGLAQFLLQQTWQNKWLGLALHDAGQPGTAVVEVGIERWLRAYGSLPHPNVLAGFLLVSLIILMFWHWEVHKNIEKKWREGLFIIGSYSIIFSAFVVTFSRGAWLAWFLSFVIFAVKILKEKDRMARTAGLQSLLGISVASIVVVGLFFSLWSPLFLGRAFGESRLEKKSTDERIIYQDYAQELRLDSWLVGIGLGNFTGAVYQKIDSKLPAYFYQPVHNIYLLSWVEIGFAALFFWAVLIFWIFKSARKRLNQWHLILISFLVIGLFDHYLWSLPVGIWMFWLAVALANVGMKVDKA